MVIQYTCSLNKNLFLSSISAGLEIGFTIFLMATLFSLFSGVVHPSVLHVMLAFAYPLGFIFVIIGKSELFTEHTTLAVIPVLNRNASVKSLLVLWGVVYAGNLLGGFLFAYIMILVTDNLGILITTVIGIGGLHHSIIGSIEVFAAWITSSGVNHMDYLHVQTWSTLGNIIGGVVFVAFVKFSHVNSRPGRSG